MTENTPAIALPADFRAFDRDKLGVQLKWTQATDDPLITGYEWRYNPSADGGWTAWEAIAGTDASTSAVYTLVEQERTDYMIRLRAVRGAEKGPEALAHVTTGEIRHRRYQVYDWARFHMHSSAYQLHLARGHKAMKQIDEFVCHVVQFVAFSDGDHLLIAKVWNVVERNINLDLMRQRQQLVNQVRILDNWEAAQFDRHLYQVAASWKVEKVAIIGVSIPSHLSVRQTDVDRLVLGG